jgi:hypothetical protein
VGVEFDEAHGNGSNGFGFQSPPGIPARGARPQTAWTAAAWCAEHFIAWKPPGDCAKDKSGPLFTTIHVRYLAKAVE